MCKPTNLQRLVHTLPFKSFTNSLQFSEIMILNALRHYEYATISLDILNKYGEILVLNENKNFQRLKVTESRLF